MATWTAPAGVLVAGLQRISGAPEAARARAESGGGLTRPGAAFRPLRAEPAGTDTGLMVDEMRYNERVPTVNLGTSSC